MDGEGVIREGKAGDIARLIEIRAAVRENRLVSRRIGAAAYRLYVEAELCWVWEARDAIAGFAALDAKHSSVWALFVDPQDEGHGIGRALLGHLEEEARRRGLTALSLTTAPGTRAERFYRAAGWREAGEAANGDLRLTLTL